MSILPIGVGTPAVTAPPTQAAQSSGGSGFGDVIGKALDDLQSTQTTADQMAQQAATGTLANVHDLTIASTEAELAVQLTTAVRDKAVAAFNSIMSMPV